MPTGEIKEPPHSLEIEMSALGSMILDVQVRDRLGAVLEPKDFYRQAHRLIFQALLAIPGSPDFILLKEQLGEDLFKAGGEEYLMHIAEIVPSAASGDSYARIVKDLSRQRSLLNLGKKILLTEFGSNGVLERSLDKILTEVRAIARDGAVEAPDWVRMDSVTPKQPPWVFRPLLAEGLMSLIEGEPGDGKSALAAAIAGAVTTGRAIPGLPEQPIRPPGAAIMLCAEDSLSFSLAARLRCVNADPSRVLAKEGPFELSGKGITKIQRMAEEARQIAGDEGPIFFSIDPIMAYIGAAKNTNSDNEVRAALEELYALVAEYRLLPLAATHMNKGGDKALQRVMGSVAFAAMPRVVMLAGRDPEDDRKGVLSCVKSNIGPWFRSLGFVIDADGDGWMTFSWAVDGSDVSADDMTAPRMPHARKKRDAPKMDEFKVWLLGTLAGAALRKDALDERCEDSGFNPRYLYKVREDMALDIRTQPKAPGDGQGRAHTWWALPHFNWTELEESWKPAQPELKADEAHDPFADEE